MMSRVSRDWLVAIFTLGAQSLQSGPCVLLPAPPFNTLVHGAPT